MTTIIFAKHKNDLFVASDSKVLYYPKNKLALYQSEDFRKFIRIGYGIMGTAGGREFKNFLQRKMTVSHKSFVYLDLNKKPIPEIELKGLIKKEMEDYAKEYLRNTKGSGYVMMQFLYIDQYKMVSIYMTEEGVVKNVDLMSKEIDPNNLFNNGFVVGIGTGGEFAKEYYVREIALAKKRGESFEEIAWKSLRAALEEDALSGFKIIVSTLNLETAEIVRPFELLSNFESPSSSLTCGFKRTFARIKYELINLFNYEYLKLERIIKNHLNKMRKAAN